MREITHQSYALTLYTLYHLNELAHAESHERALERNDLARSIGFSYHQPKELATMNDKLIDAETRRDEGRPAIVTTEERAEAGKKAAALLKKAAAVTEWHRVEPDQG